MNSEFCGLCGSDITTGHAAPWGAGWLCGACLDAYGDRAPFDVLDGLQEVLTGTAKWIAAQTGASDSDARAIQLARRVLESPELAAWLKDFSVPD